MSLSLYAMVALSRDSATATEAAMKYFVLGALASGMLLYGLSMIYGATGGFGAPPTLQIAEVAGRIGSEKANMMLLEFGLVFVVAGLGFKLGTVPFHMWVPDVYQGAPTVVTLLIGSAPELAAFAFVLRILVQALDAHPLLLGAHPLLIQWQQMLILLAVLSMAIGNVTAIAQTNIKRMLAYSTISHMGFMLLGILSGSLSGYSSAMFYMVTYVLTVAGAFAMIMLLSRGGFEADSLDDFKGLNQRSPWYAFLMLLIMFSLAGVPPVVGFYAKLSVFQAVMAAGMTWLVVVAILFSLIGAFYYLRVVKLMYFDDPQDRVPLAPTADVHVLLTINGLAVLVLGLLPGGLMDLCQRAIQNSL
jgi:NADH-quinone oxidoreductase subunit N